MTDELRSSSTKVQTRSSLVWRAIPALPLLLFAYVCQKALFDDLDSVGDHVVPILEKGAYPFSNGSSIPLNDVYFGIKGFDAGMRQFVAAFLPVFAWLSREQTLQALTFFVDLLPLHITWIIESMRRADIRTFSKYPMMWVLTYNLLAVGRVAPFYFFLHYMQCPSTKYTYSFQRKTEVRYAKTILPATIIGLLLPVLGQFCPWFTFSSRQTFCAYFQLFPIWVSLLHFLFAFFVPAQKSKSQAQDLAKDANADMPYLRLAYGFAVLFSGAYYLRVWALNPSLMAHYYLRNFIWSPKNFASLAQGMEYILIWDQITGFGAGILWAILHFWDLKQSGRLDAGWPKILGVLVGLMLIAGPGAALAGMWWWREEVLSASLGPVTGTEKGEKEA